MADEIDKQIDVVDGTITQEQANEPVYVPAYQVYENTRIPVSKAVGKLWKMRWSECKRLMEHCGDKDRWDEVIRYYQNDQGGRNGKRTSLGDLSTGRADKFKYGSENIVFANVSALVPATYAKNPDVEITSTKSENEPQAKLYERLIDQLFRRKTAPGLNIKPKVRRAVVTTTLTNISYLELTYVRKEDSSEEVVSTIEELSKQLSEAKKIDEIKEIEGKLLALEGKVSFLSPSGPRIRFVMPDMVFGDPNREDEDICSGDYVIIGEYVRTDYLRAMYGKKDENGEWMSIYQPSHVLSGTSDSQGHDDEINNFTLLDGGAEHENYGYKSKEEFDHNCHTLCWKVWDKTTRRVLMFNDKDWSWPIWVWDDPYNLSRFYNIFSLSYYTDPTKMNGKSEVMYYLDQQDEINEVNNERARMRHWAMSKVFVNTNTIGDITKVEKFLRHDSDQLVHGIDIPEGKRISDIIGAFPAPSTQFEGLFDTRPILESINRISSVTPILQNVQFKTNTTNRAIESYESSTQMRLDEKIDAIEELLADVGRALLEMCVQFMSETDVVALLGENFVQQHGGWQEAQSVPMFNEEYNFEIVGGSTLKPTAKVKKEQAMQLGQILGQFANASPMLVIVLLKMLERAFSDDVVITPEEWTTIVEATTQQMQRGVSTQGGGQEQGQGGQQGQRQTQQGGGDVNAMMTQIEGIIEQLPPEAKQFLGEGIAQGVPLKQLVQQIMQAAEQGE
jgi:hypothetical protein